MSRYREPRWRDPRVLVALALGVVVLAGTLAARPLLRSPADAALAAAGAAGWHGAYDILVTGKGSHVGTAGLLPPDQLVDEPGTVTEGQLARLRRIPGIDVAAPIGVGYSEGLGGSGLSLDIPAGDPALVQAAQQPQLWHTTVELSSDDGTGIRRTLGTSFRRFVLDLTPGAVPAPDAQCRLNDVVLDPAQYPDAVKVWCGGATADQSAAVYLVDGDGRQYQFTTSTTAAGVTIRAADTAVTPQRIVFVDPAAERELLGPAGDFLAPLDDLAPAPAVTVADVTSWLRAHPDADPGQTDIASALEELQKQNDASTAAVAAAARDIDRYNAAHPEAPLDLGVGQTQPLLLVPILARDTPAALTADISVGDYGAAPRLPGADAGDPDHGGSEPRYLVTAGDDQAAQDFGPDGVDVSELLEPFSGWQGLELPWPGSTAAAPAASAPLRGVQFSAQAAPLRRPDYRVAPSRPGAPPRVTMRPQAYVGVPFDVDGQGFSSPQFSSARSAPVAGSESAYFEPRLLSAVQGGSPGQLGARVGTIPAAIDRGAAPLGAYTPIGDTVTEPDGHRIRLKPAVMGLGPLSGTTSEIAALSSAAALGDATPIDAVRVRVTGTDGYDAAGRARVLQVAQAIRMLGLKATVVVGSTAQEVEVTIAGYAFGDVAADGQQRTGTLGTTTQSWTRLGAAATAPTVVPAAAFAVWALALVAALVLLAGVPALVLARAASRAAGGGTAPRAPWMRMPRLALDPPATLTGFGLREALVHPSRWLPVLAGLATVLALAGVAVSAALDGLGAVPVALASAGAVCGAVLTAFALWETAPRRDLEARALRAAGWTTGERLIALAAEALPAVVLAVAAAGVVVAVFGTGGGR